MPYFWFVLISPILKTQKFHCELWWWFWTSESNPGFTNLKCQTLVLRRCCQNINAPSYIILTHCGMYSLILVVVWVLLWVHSTVPLYNTPSWQLVDFNAVKSSVGIKYFYKIEFTNMQIIKYLVVMWDPKIKEDMPCSLESYFVTKCHKEHSIFQNQCFYKQFHNCKLKMENVIMHCEHCFFYI